MKGFCVIERVRRCYGLTIQVARAEDASCAGGLTLPPHGTVFQGVTPVGILPATRQRFFLRRRSRRVS